jgi:hypothetical protein
VEATLDKRFDVGHEKIHPGSDLIWFEFAMPNPFIDGRLGDLEKVTDFFNG